MSTSIYIFTHFYIHLNINLIPEGLYICYQICFQIIFIFDFIFPHYLFIV